MVPAFLSAAARLCSECGMCCNGVLFHSVELQSDDSPRALTASGLRIKRKAGRGYFLQPCAAHQGSCCSIHERRPVRCKQFNCQQIVRLAANETTEADALKKIHAARTLVARVNELINEVAETNPNRGLAQRCANALTTSNRTPVHDELASVMRDLESLLKTEFRME